MQTGPLEKPHPDTKIKQGERGQRGHLVENLTKPGSQSQHLIERHHGMRGRQHVKQTNGAAAHRE